MSLLKIYPVLAGKSNLTVRDGVELLRDRFLQERISGNRQYNAAHVIMQKEFAIPGREYCVQIETTNGLCRTAKRSCLNLEI